MGKRGPKPKPTALRILEGNPGRREFNLAEPMIFERPQKPGTVAMDPIASREWDAILAVMPAGVYTVADTALLAQYAMAQSISFHCAAELDKRGVFIEVAVRNREGDIIDHLVQVNPAIKTWKTAHAALVQLASHLGLSPGMRSRLNVPKPAEMKSKFAGLIAS
jgi:P27 family predicted phage terminase small subunit